MPPAEKGPRKHRDRPAPEAKAKGGRPGGAAPKDAKPSEFQLHPTFQPFQWWVIDKLVGIYANDRNNVVVHIVGRWIDENRDSLGSKDITFQGWRDSPKLRGVVKDFPPTPDKKISPDTSETPPEADGDGSAKA
jgi:hypothetical protein